MPLLSDKERDAYLILCAYSHKKNHGELPDHIKTLSIPDLIDLCSAVKKVENAIMKIIEATCIKVRECTMYKPECMEGILKNDVMRKPFSIFKKIISKGFEEVEEGEEVERTGNRKDTVHRMVRETFSLFSLDEIEELYQNPDRFFHYMSTPAKSSKLSKRISDPSNNLEAKINLYETITNNMALEGSDATISVSNMKKDIADKYQKVQSLIKAT